MICPKCRKEQPDSDTCIFCQIVVVKYLKLCPSSQLLDNPVPEHKVTAVRSDSATSQKTNDVVARNDLIKQTLAASEKACTSALEKKRTYLGKIALIAVVIITIAVLLVNKFHYVTVTPKEATVIPDKTVVQMAVVDRTIVRNPPEASVDSHVPAGLFNEPSKDKNANRRNYSVMPIPAGSAPIAKPATRSYRNKTDFLAAAAGALTMVGFDEDSNGNSIDARDGVLADTLFAGYGITFHAGVVFGYPDLSFHGVTSPNIITNTGNNTPTPALVDATFISPVHEVGITNVGAKAILRIFDSNNVLIASITSDSGVDTPDFIGLISDVPIHRMQYDFVSGIGFGADDLLFTQIGY